VRSPNEFDPASPPEVSGHAPAPRFRAPGARGLLALRPVAWLLGLMDEVQAESGPPRPVGRHELGVILTACAGLMVIQFATTEDIFFEIYAAWHASEVEGIEPGFARFLLRNFTFYPLASLLFWIGGCVVGYFVLPAAYLRLTGRKLADFYLGTSGFREHKWLYLGAIALMLPVLAIVSYSPAFQEIYPFYVGADRSWFDLVVWEAAYVLQFFALEFFFRAFLLEGLRPSFGVGAVFLMLLPYCMVHFPKTGAESAASIIAGLVLGVLAMRYRSIWGGVLVHSVVAIGMDVLSLIQKGQFPPSALFPGG
jgi:membrane protease YdiL (CAAX protease family)